MVGFGVQASGFGFGDFWCGVRVWRFGVWGFGVLGLVFGVRYLVFGLEIGVCWFRDWGVNAGLGIGV